MKTQDFMWGTMNSGAVFGRYRKAQVTFHGDQAYTDGEQIVVPTLPFDRDMSQAEINAARGYLDHEAGHIRHTDFETFLDFAKRATSDQNLQGLKELHNCFEDIWLERRVQQDYPGSTRNLSSMWDACRVKQLNQIAEEGPPQHKIGHGMMGMTNIGRKGYSTERYDELIKHIDPKIVEYCEKWCEEVHKCNNTGEVIEHAKAAYKILKELEEGKEPEMQPEDCDSESMIESGQGMKLPDYKESEEEQAEAGKMVPEGGFEKGVRHKVQGRSPSDNDSIVDDKEGSESTCDIVYDQTEPTNNNYTVYSTKQDEVFTRKSSNRRSTHNSKRIKQRTDKDYEKIKAEISAYSNVMKTKLKRALMARQRRDWDFGREFGKLDTKRLVPAYNRQRNVYKKRMDREELDTAVNMLVDLSGSMGYERSHLAAQAVVAMCECLEGTGIKYQVTGFSTGGNLWGFSGSDNKVYHRTGHMNYYKFKEFGEPLRVARGAISTISEGAEGENADRCAVEWAANELKNRKESRKVLLVFSDGQPACRTKGVGMQSLRTTLKIGVDKIHKDGIQTVGIGIQSDSVSDLYQQSKVVNNLADLTNTTFDQLTKVILDGRIIK